MTSFEAKLYLQKKHGDAIEKHPLWNAIMVCIEGIAAIVRGEINHTHGKSVTVDIVIVDFKIYVYISFFREYIAC